MAHDLRIEGIARDAHAGVAQQVLSRAAPLQHGGSNADQREVAGAAAEIPNQDEFILRQRRLVIMRRRDGLHLKLDVSKASKSERIAQATFGVRVVGFRLRAHELHGTAGDGRGHRKSEGFLRTLAQIAQDARD